MATNQYLIPKLAPTFHATITLPGSKSIALRQLAMAALAHGTTKIFGIPPCDDTEAMLECLSTLGAGVKRTAEHIAVKGPMDFNADVTLDARMSGASTRLLIGLAALRTGKTTIDGHSSLRARTNAPLFDVLSAHGVSVDTENGQLPVSIQGPITPPERFEIDGSLSSQYVTALLLCAPHLARTDKLDIHIKGDLVSRPYIDITLNEMAKRGVTAQWVDNQTLTVEKKEYTPGEIQVEGDATAATYFAALATLHNARVELTNLGAKTRQGDYAFLNIMARLGAKIRRNVDTTEITGPQHMSGLPAMDMTDMPDAALTLIALAPLIPGSTSITGLSSLHHKECDRLECPAAEFRHLGVQAQTTEDAIQVEEIEPSMLQAHTLKTYHDHRMAMAFSILGSVSGNLSVDDKQVVNKTYPDYWRDYTSLNKLAL
jgi:3-phosphoshikimate 1-carboxyvinyltransferase